MPAWLWILVIVGLGAGAVETMLGDRHRSRQRSRHRRDDALSRGFRWSERDHTRRIAPLLVLLPATAGAENVRDVASGMLRDGTPVTLFDFDLPGHETDQLHTGFVLHYGTDWPTLELQPDGLNPLVQTPTEHDRSTHDLSRALLASDLLHLLAAHPRWVFAFSGDAVFGSAPAHDTADFATVLGIAEGVAIRLPAQAVNPWRRIGQRDQRRAAGE